MIPKQESPITICTANTIGNVRSRRLFRVLLDSGSTVSMIKRSAIPVGAVTKDIGKSKSIRTLAGQLNIQFVIMMQDIQWPEFDKIRWIKQQKVLVFDNDKVKYDINLGTPFQSWNSN